MKSKNWSLEVICRAIGMTITGFVLYATLDSNTLMAQTPATDTAHYDPTAWAKIVEAAKKEGVVHYYSAPSPEHAQKLIAGFRKEYPEIQVEVERASTGVLMAKIDQERSAGVDGADVWVGADRSWFEARAKEGKLLRPSGPGLVGWPGSALIDGTIVIPNSDPFVITYNKKLVTSPIKDNSDMLKPEFKGKIGLSEATGISEIAWYLWVEKTLGEGTWQKLADQQPKFYAGASQLIQSLAVGEISLAPGVSNIAVAKPIMQTGAPIDYVVPNPVFGFQYAAGAFAWSKRPNAALVFLDFIMSVEGQTIWAGTGESASPRQGIPGSLNYSSITPFDPKNYPPDLVKASFDRWHKVFNK